MRGLAVFLFLIPAILGASPKSSSTARAPMVGGMDLGVSLSGPPPLPETKRESSPEPSGGQGGAAAGPSEGLQFRVAQTTRWDQVKRSLSELIQAYVGRDLSGFMKAVSKEYEQDASVLRNAVAEDFQQEANFSVDLELLSYQVSRNVVSVQLRWNRISLDQASGEALPVRTGNARVLFDRESGFLMKSWLGPAPFGIRDPQFQNQIAAGQPSIGEPSFFTRTLRIPDNDEFGGIVFDFEAGTVRGIIDPGLGVEPEIFAGDDLAINGDEPFLDAFDPRTQISSMTPNQAGVLRCNTDPSDVLQFRAVSGSLQSQIQFPEIPVVNLGGRTQEGNFYVLHLEITDFPDVETIVRASWIVREGGADVVNPQGTLGCQ